MEYFYILLGIVILLYGITAFKNIPRLNFMTSYWGAERFNASGLRRLIKKFLGIMLMIAGALVILVCIGLVVSKNRDQENAKNIVVESSALGVPLEEYKAYKSALIFLPRDTTFEQYRLVDAEGRSKGFKNGYQYLSIIKRAKDTGITIEQYVQLHPTESSAVSDGQAFVVIPEGEFFTDRGQISRAAYKLACQKALPDYERTAIPIKLGYSSYPEGKLIANLGISAISQAKIWWDESYGCLGSFVVSGMVNGSNHIIPLQGKVQSFENYGGAVRGIIRTY